MISTQNYPKLDQPEVLEILFHPRKEMDSPPQPNTTDLDIPVANDVTIGARFHHAAKDDPTILFFHGNGEIVGDYDSIGPKYSSVGLNFLVVDYRGYGRSGGVPSVSHMLNDTHAIFQYASGWLKEHGISGPLLVMGRSLGSACALEIAATYKNDIVGLIIESGFATTLPLLMRLGADINSLGITEADGFKNVQKISQFPKPTFILHAQHDQIIPLDNAEILQVQSPARSKEFQVVPGADHNSILVHAGKFYFETIKKFAYRISGRKTKKNYYRRKTKD